MYSIVQDNNTKFIIHHAEVKIMGKRGVAKPSSIVIDATRMKQDWVSKMPDRQEREEALREIGSNWGNISNMSSKSHTINGRCNISKQMYAKLIKVSGLDPTAYIVEGADPNDYVESKARDYNEAQNLDLAESLNRITDSITTTGGASMSETVVTETRTMTSGAKLTKTTHLKSTDQIISEMDTKMTSFVNHLQLYMCALHIDADKIIHDTGIEYFRKIRDKQTTLGLSDYVTLSQYLCNQYLTCTNKEYTTTFGQIAELFCDIYVKSVYFGESIS